jgi:hypothetical protein
MTTTRLKTVEMTRRIRDQHYEQLKDKTPTERIAFYRQQAQELHRRLHIPLPEQHDERRTQPTDLIDNALP